MGGRSTLSVHDLYHDGAVSQFLLDSRAAGRSYREIAMLLNRDWDIHICHQTVPTWVKRARERAARLAELEAARPKQPVVPARNIPQRGQTR